MPDVVMDREDDFMARPEIERRADPARPPVRADRERPGGGRRPGDRRAPEVRRRAVGAVQRGGPVESRRRLPGAPGPRPSWPPRRREPPAGLSRTTSGTPASGRSTRRPPSCCARPGRPGPTTSPSTAGCSHWWASMPVHAALSESPPPPPPLAGHGRARTGGRRAHRSTSRRGGARRALLVLPLGRPRPATRASGCPSTARPR